ncbi:class I SAM-dependent methyltransferase [Nocardia sp. NPDC057353]|uniref:class I SAM-dependent methyltransferase n=1 Tax=Nocardia sp. NPDC057353 TaxID=3346104 RepID=UPI003640CF11
MTNSHPTVEISKMPRGGPDASWINRRLQTKRPEITDRYDISDNIKQKVIGTLDRFGERFGLHALNAQMVLAQIEGLDNPRILEIGAGHGGVSAEILRLHPSAEVTVSDLDPGSVANIAAGPLGEDPRCTVKVIDATDIDEPENSFDLVVFAVSMHHLPPGDAVKVIADATRVGKKFLVIDLERSSTPGILLAPLLLIPTAIAVLMVSPPSAVPLFLHDSLIGTLRAYSRSAFSALGAAADPDMIIEFPAGGPEFLPWIPIVFTRTDRSKNSRDEVEC